MLSPKQWQPVSSTIRGKRYKWVALEMGLKREREGTRSYTYREPDGEVIIACRSKTKFSRVIGATRIVQAEGDPPKFKAGADVGQLELENYLTYPI